MSTTKIMTRRVADLITPSDLGENLLKFNQVILPCGRMPAGYEIVEGMTLSQIADVIIEHLDVAGLIPDLSGGGTPSEGTPTDSVTFNYTFNDGATIPLDDVEILMFDGSDTMRVNDTFELDHNPSQPNYFMGITTGPKWVFYNFHPSNAPIKIAIRLIPENQNMLQNLQLTGNTTFKWKEENKAYVGTLLPFPKPQLSDVTYDPSSGVHVLIEGTALNLKDGAEYEAYVTFMRTDINQMVVLRSADTITSANKNFTIGGDIPVDMGPYYVSLQLKDTTGWRDVVEAELL
ncbi:hypothetical protein EAb13_CDS0059 [Acinetobacter phage EAb13]|nr:hypothetical protein EAb13_CDS0059 [Acinetobacter phage EAb13]